MQSAIVQMILIVVGIAAAAIVTIIVYSQLTKSTDEIDKQDDLIYDYDDITSENLCNAVGGTWDSTKKTCGE